MHGLQPVFDHHRICGGGSFSDGKLSLSPDVGESAGDSGFMKKTVQLLKESDDIYLKFGADSKVYGLDKEKELQEIRKKRRSTQI